MRPEVSAGPPGARLLTTRTSDELRRASLNTIPTPAGALSDPGGRTEPARELPLACRAGRGAGRSLAAGARDCGSGGGFNQRSSEPDP